MFAVNLLFFLLYTLRRTKPYCQRQPVARARVMALLLSLIHIFWKRS